MPKPTCFTFAKSRTIVQTSVGVSVNKDPFFAADHAGDRSRHGAESKIEHETRFGARNFDNSSSSLRCRDVFPVNGRAPSGVPTPFSAATVSRCLDHIRVSCQSEIVVGRNLQILCAIEFDPWEDSW